MLAIITYKTMGFNDALNRKECCPPWSDKESRAIRRTAEYICGYLEGEEILKQIGESL